MREDKIFRITLEYKGFFHLENVTSIFYEAASKGSEVTVSKRKRYIQNPITVTLLVPRKIGKKFIIWCYEEDYAEGIHLLDKALLKEFEGKYLMAKRELEQMQKTVKPILRTVE